MSDLAVVLSNVFCVHRSGEGDAAALQGLSLRVGTGEIVGVLGPSGAGKSTLLSVIAGLRTPSAGDAHVLGDDIGRLAEGRRARIRRARIGYLAQRSTQVISPDLPVLEAVALPLGLRGVGAGARRDRARELLSTAGLGDRTAARWRELSGGERQRVAVCAALAHQPALLLADEPTGELDAAAADRVRRLLRELVRSRGATAIIVSHDPATEAACDRIVSIRDGRVVAEGDALVVAADGTLQLPDELRAEVGIGDRVRSRSSADGALLTPVPGAPASPPGQDAAAGLLADLGRGVRAEVRELTVTYPGRRVFERLSAAFPAGALTVLAGPSGAGKSTLLRCLAGLNEVADGEVLVAGRALPVGAEDRARVRRELIGYLAQDPAPAERLSAIENVALALALRGVEPEPAQARAAEAIAAVGLAHRARQRCGRLSAGELQRVCLARAIVCARGLLLLDEPTSRLDSPRGAEIARLVRRLADGGLTVVSATHDTRLHARADSLIRLG